MCSLYVCKIHWYMCRLLHIAINQSKLLIEAPYQGAVHSQMKFQDCCQEESQKRSRYQDPAMGAPKSTRNASAYYVV